MIERIVKKIFGSKSARDLKKMRPLVARVNELEVSYQNLSEAELKNKTVEFKERLKNGETLDDIMCEAFAVVKNACRRLVGQEVEVCGQSMVWDMIPFDVQILGAIALHRGNIAEMATGEGKTLVASMPLYLNALSGRNCQLVTVNDYLARRDSEWMGTIYRYLGLTVGCLQGQMPSNIRREQYRCDITYGTNSEFGFDYLRDMGMATEARHLVQRDHFYAIIDEIDSILIDEARTPLIISGPVPMSSHQFDQLQPKVAQLFSKQNLLCSKLVQEAKSTLEREGISAEERENALLKLLQVKFGMPTHKQLLHVLEDGSILKEVERLDSKVHSDNNRGLLQEVQGDLYFAIDEKSHGADLTEKGRNALSPNDPEAFIMPDLLLELHNIENDASLSEEERLAKRQKFEADYAVKSERLHDLSQLLKAYCLFEKDVHYVVQDDKVMIVDEHTGRLMPGRRFSDGLHQALEAKERVKIEQETQTLATITIQNYFRLYEKLAGMTGTAETEANEFHQIYKLDVIVVPTNRPCQRIDANDSIFKTRREKFNAIVEETAARHAKGQPVLLGTISVEDSEIVSRMLKRKNIPHNVLNAKNHQLEAEIVANAGRVGAVTVATNMAGRGTDIKLGPGVADLGGLHVIGRSRPDSRRIDRQVRGRCSRQGDPGASKFYVSLEDNLMRLFGGDRVIKIFERFGLEEGEELEHPWLNRSIETAQRRVEQQHFAIRKRTLEFDDVMNKQREIIYGLRKDALLSEKPLDTLMYLVEQHVLNKVQEIALGPAKGEARTQNDGEFDMARLVTWLKATFPIDFQESELTAGFRAGSKAAGDGRGPLRDPSALTEQIVDKIEVAYNRKNEILPREQCRYLERHTVLDAIDRLWQEHLYTMDSLRSSIYLRVYAAQKDPLVEYKHEAFKAFEVLMGQIEQEAVANMFRATIATLESFERLLESLPQELIHRSFGQFDMNELLSAGRKDGRPAIPGSITISNPAMKPKDNGPRRSK
ncbi:preprotein translocase subunit SecA [Victivallis sp. Marseille-Q1083]|uniref:preprotein translocase subunit SecA n=1 Tax=Victivallis sp. Marseille-Q1083 TaxID=2717288 RepID=UPI001589756C|nr:preprotein translocase subunit SecA [Victivallis sp. Marseille-Q1083]